MDTPTTYTGELAELEMPPVKVAAGLGTYAGLAGAAAAAAPVVIAFLTDERIAPSTRNLLVVVAGALLAVVILVRGAQAVAAELARGRGAGQALPDVESVAAAIVRGEARGLKTSSTRDPRR